MFESLWWTVHHAPGFLIKALLDSTLVNDPDENVEAARVVRESTTRDDALPAGIEAAWEAWSAGIQGCDERTKILLRAAFEAGIDARQDDDDTFARVVNGVVMVLICGSPSPGDAFTARKRFQMAPGPGWDDSGNVARAPG